MIAEEGNLTRAARRLNASQPAVSAHVKALEDELGLALFLRTPKGMVLTADGLKLKEHADRVLATIEEMSDAAGRMRGLLQGELRIGINAEPETLRIPELFTCMKTHHPGLHIHLLQAMTGEVLNKLEEGALDAGFMYGENGSERLWVTKLKQMRLVVAGPNSWRNRLAAATAAQLGSFPWITTPGDCPFHTVAEDFFKRHGLEPQQVAVVDQESIIRSMVRAGAGLSLLQEQEVIGDVASERLAIWAKEPLTMTLSFACLKRRKDEPRLQTLFSILSRIWEPEATD
jgi:DNA-binding transcriptional LysR family regulator